MKFRFSLSACWYLKIACATLISLSIGIPTGSGQGYKLTGRNFSPGVQIDPELLNYQYQQGFGDILRTYSTIAADSAFNLITRDIQLKTLEETNLDTIKDRHLNFLIKDVTCSDKFDVFIGNQKLFIYQRQIRLSNYLELKNIDFNHGYLINDTCLFLYSIYNYHPADGFAGLNMAVYNINENKIIATRKERFPGVALSHMAVNWCFTDDSAIYTISPMDGIVSVYNFNLEPLTKKVLKIPWTNILSNKLFQEGVDKKILKAHTYFGQSQVRNNQKENLFVSEIYQKNFISTVIDSVRRTYDYIEKIFPVDSSSFLISICRAGYQLDFRDVYLFDIKTMNLIREIKKWPCGAAEHIVSLEDYFVVDLINSEPYANYFFGNKVYSSTFYDPAALTTGNKDSVERHFHNEILKKGFSWHILEYSY